MHGNVWEWWADVEGVTRVAGGGGFGSPGSMCRAANRRSDSPAERSCDFGFRVALVGPGPAYERWKKTPEYQQWLKETGQAKK
jgi:hypothetical protein